ncbi:unnamed protein product [Closterium sp. Yama58-4]|nr:unnamed protein product [Closterium sp. Yama58-4]
MLDNDNNRSHAGSPFTGLEELLITDCSELESFPDHIGHLLPYLRTLTVRKCRSLICLPKSFASLSRFEALIFYKCDLFTLPSNFGDLPALKLLVLALLPLFELPPSFCHLTSLEALFLVGCNDLRRLPAGFYGLTALKAFCITAQALALPEDIGALTSLKALSLRELKVQASSIRTLPMSLSRLTGLQTLEMSACNELSEVPSRLDMLVGLKTLELTPCEKLSKHLVSLPPSLQTLRLGRLEGSSHVIDIFELSQLRELQLSSAEQVERLEMGLTHEGRELPIHLTILSHLRHLVICGDEGCYLTENLGAALPQLRQLELLSWSSEELPGSIVKLSSMTSFTIEAPRVVSLPQGMRSLSRLRKLELICCSALQHLPECLSQLHQLILRDTSIRSPPANLMQLV